jgi:hypothetical protein
VTIAPTAALTSESLARMSRRRLTIELLGCAVVYFVYDWVRDVVAGSETAAQRNASHVVAAERMLGVFHEAWLQGEVVRHRLVVQIADGYYGWIHFAVPIVVAAALLWRGDRAQWVRWRTIFFILCAFGLVGFRLFPVAPPRLLPAHFGFVDTMSMIGGPGIRPASASDVGNAFAAMPSLHAGWSLWSACVVWSLTRDRVWRGLTALHVALTVVVIAVTGNHYVLDAVVGWCCVGLAILVYDTAARYAHVRATFSDAHHATGRVGSP